MNRIYRLTFLSYILVLQSACAYVISPTVLPSATPSFGFDQAASTETRQIPLAPPIITSTPFRIPEIESTESIQTLRFAVIGDYGQGNSAEQDVAEMVLSWRPDFIITTGDNNYPNGAADTIDQRIGQYYQSYIFPYHGTYGTGSTENLFFPSMGNHDWIPDQAQPYLDYFNLPGNERYYQFYKGAINFYVLDSDAHEPDGVNSSSIQAEWLKDQLSASSSSWNIVFFHHPPYSSGLHGSIDWMRWPFKSWGVDLVISGHDHTYERLMIDDLTYVVNGLGGGSIYDFITPISGSLVRYNQDYGAMLIEADQERLRLMFYNRSGELIDDATLTISP